FEDAIALAQRMGAIPYLALTRLSYAEMLLRRGAPGDAPKAASLLSAARITFEALGMTSHLERAANVSAAPPAVNPAASPAASVRFSRDGDVWAVDYAGATLRIKGSDGLRYLAYLVERPHTEVHVGELIADARGAQSGVRAAGGADPGLAS